MEILIMDCVGRVVLKHWTKFAIIFHMRHFILRLT